MVFQPRSRTAMYTRCTSSAPPTRTCRRSGPSRTPVTGPACTTRRGGAGSRRPRRSCSLLRATSLIAMSSPERDPRLATGATVSGDVTLRLPAGMTAEEAVDELRDRVAIVTGAGQGMGRAFAQALCDAGARVALAEVNEESGRPAAA